MKATETKYLQIELQSELLGVGKCGKSTKACARGGSVCGATTCIKQSLSGTSLRRVNKKCFHSLPHYLVFSIAQQIKLKTSFYELGAHLLVHCRRAGQDVLLRVKHVERT